MRRRRFRTWAKWACTLAAVLVAVLWGWSLERPIVWRSTLHHRLVDVCGGVVLVAWVPQSWIDADEKEFFDQHTATEDGLRARALSKHRQRREDRLSGQLSDRATALAAAELSHTPWPPYSWSGDPGPQWALTEAFEFGLWIPFAAFTAAASALWWPQVQAKFRRAPWGCPHCGYDRRGIDPHGACPECGTVPARVDCGDAAGTVRDLG
jgi:hypothetical protein